MKEFIAVDSCKVIEQNKQISVKHITLLYTPSLHALQMSAHVSWGDSATIDRNIQLGWWMNWLDADG